MLRIFFTGAFRKPRELNWVIGFVLFVLAMGEGFTGYSLPDDLLSGNGLRIIDGMVKGIPLIGTWTSFLLFGGEFPGTAIVGRLYTLHILLLPAILVGLLVRAPHADGHQQAHAVRRPRPHEQQRRGLPDDAGLHVQDGRLPLHHVRRDRADRIAVHDQPDLELRSVRPVPRLGRNAARLVHRLRRRCPASGSARAGRSSSWTAPGRSTSSCRSSDSGCSSSLVAIYPFIEAWITGDKREHHIAQRPRNAATRTAIGAAGVTFYAVLWAAASSDIIATHFYLTMEGVIHTLQALLIVGPIIAYFVTKRICIALQKKDREIALHGYESGRIVRLPGGEYIEVHQPVDEYERWKLVDNETLRAARRPPERQGPHPLAREASVPVVSRWLFEDRLAAAHAGRDRCGRRPPAPRAGAHRDRGGPGAPGRPRARRRAGRTARADRRRSQLRDGRSPVERDHRRRRSKKPKKREKERGS